MSLSSLQLKIKTLYIEANTLATITSTARAECFVNNTVIGRS